MKKYKVGFIGYGNMAQAIVSSLILPINKHILKQFDCKLSIAVSDPDADKLKMAPKNISVTTDNNALVDACDIIVLAIKPQSARQALEGIDFSNKLVISIMASVTFSAIKDYTGNTTERIARIMPNMNAKIGMAHSAYCFYNVSEREKNLVRGIAASIGTSCEVSEEKMNAATGICGSGPAFVFEFIEAFVDNAIKNGFNRSVAFEMAVHTIIGSAALVEHLGADVDIKNLINSVCSKGGTTIEGIKHLDAHGFKDISSGAIDKAIARAEEMSIESENR